MLLDVRKVCKTYRQGGRELRANRNISFSVAKGEILGLLGPNGAGKTTLIKQIVGLLLPDSGNIAFRETDVALHPECVRSRCSLLLEGMRNIYPYLAGRANLLYFAYLNQVPPDMARERSEALLKKMGLWEARDKFAFEYSSGMNRKLAIASCLINEPELVILDEPTSGLDVVAVEDLIALIRDLANSEERTFILVSHDMHFIEKAAKRVVWLKDGAIWMDGGVEEIKNSKGQKTVLLSIANSSEAREFLDAKSLPYTHVSDSILQLSLNSRLDKEILTGIISRFEVLNIEKQSSDFEAVFKELHRDECSSR